MGYCSLNLELKSNQSKNLLYLWRNLHPFQIGIDTDDSLNYSVIDTTKICCVWCCCKGNLCTCIGMQCHRTKYLVLRFGAINRKKNIWQQKGQICKKAQKKMIESWMLNLAHRAIFQDENKWTNNKILLKGIEQRMFIITGTEKHGVRRRI